MAISRMQQPRQQYGLGSIVKKAVRGVKKIAKSPIGKAALLYAGTAGLGSIGSNATGFSRFSGGNFMAGLGKARSGISNLFRAPSGKDKGGFLQSLIRNDEGGISAGKLALGGLGVASIAPLFMGGDNEEVEESVTQLDPLATVQSAKNYYSGLGDQGAGLNFMPKKKYVSQNFYAADGGRANFAMGGDTDDEDEVIRMQAAARMRPAQTFLKMGGDAGNAQAEQMLMAEFVKYKNKGGDLSFEQFVKAVMQQQEQAQGMQQPMMAANGGRMNYAEGGGIMDAEAAEMIDMGGQEKDYRDEGGFVAMGGEERADDVPARLSKNEFVFTADAVRNAGGGDIDRGSEVMQNLMDNLEQGGQVSEDSQGIGGGEEMMMSEEMIEEPNGAQAMYEQQQALQSRMI